MVDSSVLFTSQKIGSPRPIESVHDNRRLPILAFVMESRRRKWIHRNKQVQAPCPPRGPSGKSSMRALIELNESAGYFPSSAGPDMDHAKSARLTLQGTS